MTIDPRRPLIVDAAGNLTLQGHIVLHAKHRVRGGDGWLLDAASINNIHAIGFEAGRLHEDDGQKILRAEKARIEAAKSDLAPLDPTDAQLEKEAQAAGERSTGGADLDPEDAP